MEQFKKFGYITAQVEVLVQEEEYIINKIWH